jgi:hypothetical protein
MRERRGGIGMSNYDDRSNLKGGEARHSSKPVGRGRRSKVVSLEEWKRHYRRESPDELASAELCSEKIRLLSLTQKQALLLRFIVSEDITNRDLDPMLKAITPRA